MRKNTANTLAHLMSAMIAGRAVTIRYIRKDGEVSRRRVEIHSFRVTNEGNITFYAWDERDQEMTTFRVDRVTHYTLHRTPKLADYRFPTYAEVADVMDDEGDLTDVSAWGTYQLTA